jgi:hypothetical protein
MKKILFKKNIIMEQKSTDIQFEKKKNQIDHFRNFNNYTLIYVYSIFEKKKRFIKGKCKQISHNKKNSMVHVISRYFNTILLIKFPIYSPKCFQVL